MVIYLKLLIYVVNIDWLELEGFWWLIIVHLKIENNIVDSGLVTSITQCLYNLLLSIRTDENLLLSTLTLVWQHTLNTRVLKQIYILVLQGSIYLILSLVALLSMLAFIVTKKHCFLYIGGGFIISVGLYLGYHRTKMRNKFNIRVSILIPYFCFYCYFSVSVCLIIYPF